MTAAEELRNTARELRTVGGAASPLRRGRLDAADRLERRACRDCGDSWRRADADPFVEAAITEILANRDEWRDAAIARGCTGLPDRERDR